MSDKEAGSNAGKDDLRPTEELIRLALTRQLDDSDESDNPDLGWEAILALRDRASREDFEAAARLCESSVPHERAVGVDILAQFGRPRAYPSEICAILLRLLETDDAPDVLRSAATAFGHNSEWVEAIPLLIRLKAHPDAAVRFAVVFGLLTQTDERAIQALIELSSDKEDHVRDWAAFGLGSQIDTDTPAIREALYRRIVEQDPSPALEEALVGLAVRKDPRFFQSIMDLLNQSEPGTLILEAAEKSGDPRFYPVLLTLKEQQLAGGEDPDSYWMHCLNDAIASCTPAG